MKEYWIWYLILHIVWKKNNNILQTTSFNHTMIFFKLTNLYKISDTYINHNNCLGHMLIK